MKTNLGRYSYFLSRRAILFLAFFAAACVSSLGADAAANRFVAKPGGAKVRIEGTSTIHDWQMESGTIAGYLEAGPDFPSKPGAEAKPGKVSAKVDAFIPVRTLKSYEKDGKPYSDKMNEVAWDKLMVGTNYPRIIYRLTELVLKEAPKSKDGAYVFDSTGELVVAGVTNKISMPVNITPMEGGKLHVVGNTKAKMSEFKIDPPSPTFGVLIKTGDEVKLLFDWIVEQKLAPAATASKP